MIRDRIKRLDWPFFAIGVLIGFLIGMERRVPVPAPTTHMHVIALPGPTLNDMCPQRAPRVWLPFRSPRHVHAVPQCGEPTISRNQAGSAPLGAVHVAPMARGSLPNSLAAYLPPAGVGPDLTQPPAYWQPVDVPFEDYPVASAPPTKRCKKHHKCKPVTVSFGQAPMGLLIALFGGAAWVARRRVS